MEERETITVEEMIREVRSYIKNKKVLSMRQTPFYGKIELAFQSGENAYLRIEETVK